MTIFYRDICTKPRWQEILKVDRRHVVVKGYNEYMLMTANVDVNGPHSCISEFQVWKIIFVWKILIIIAVK